MSNEIQRLQNRYRIHKPRAQQWFRLNLEISILQGRRINCDKLNTSELQELHIVTLKHRH